MNQMRCAGFAVWMAVAALSHEAFAAPPPPPPGDATIPVIENGSIGYDADAVEGAEQGSYHVFKFGTTIESDVELPPAPAAQRDARRIVVTVEIEPAIITEGGKRRPADPWTRLGNVTCFLPTSMATPIAKPEGDQRTDLHE